MLSTQRMNTYDSDATFCSDVEIVRKTNSVQRRRKTKSKHQEKQDSCEIDKLNSIHHVIELHLKKVQLMGKEELDQKLKDLKCIKGTSLSEQECIKKLNRQLNKIKIGMKEFHTQYSSNSLNGSDDINLFAPIQNTEEMFTSQKSNSYFPQTQYSSNFLNGTGDIHLIVPIQNTEEIFTSQESVSPFPLSLLTNDDFVSYDTSSDKSKAETFGCIVEDTPFSTNITTKANEVNVHESDVVIPETYLSESLQSKTVINNRTTIVNNGENICYHSLDTFSELQIFGDEFQTIASSETPNKKSETLKKLEDVVARIRDFKINVESALTESNPQQRRVVGCISTSSSMSDFAKRASLTKEEEEFNQKILSSVQLEARRVAVHEDKDLKNKPSLIKEIILS